MSQRSVLVVGATGKQGGAVANHLLSEEYGEFDVHALTRSPESEHARTLADRGATIVGGDLQNENSYREAVEDVDAVYCMTHFVAGYDSEVEQGTNMAEVAADGGVDQFVFSSVGGAERDTGVPHFESKWEVEQRIRDLDLPATIVRPVFFMQNFEMQRETIADGTIVFPFAEGNPVQMVDVDNIGAFVATALADPDRYIGEAVELAGDERTLEAVAEVFSAPLRTNVETQHVPMDAARERMGEDQALMFEWISEYGYEADIDDLDREYEIELTDFETYVSNNWTEPTGR
jgi:uncharacterized protein YbjT (DUF2867 family)